MGALAEGFVAYAQPLIDETDGSEEQLNKAIAITQFCYNLALLPDDRQETALSEMRPSLQMDEEEFESFRRSVIVPMIQRHQDMFPSMHRGVAPSVSQSVPSPWAGPRRGARAEKYPGTDRYAPCPCKSGKKYKFCCGKKGS